MISGGNISESSIGRIMRKLRFLRSRSTLNRKKNRRFDKYVKPFNFKQDNAMMMDEKWGSDEAFCRD